MYSDFNPLEKLTAYLRVACFAKISALKWRYLNGYLNYAVISDLVFNYTEVITLESTSFTLPWENARVADAFRQWVISTPCWPGNEFTYFKQFRVNTRNINDENTLRDPSHKGSCITTRSVCEGTGPASQTREVPHGVQIWPMIEGWGWAKKCSTHSWAPP